MDFSWLTGFISSAITALVGYIENLFYTCGNALISGVASACSAVINLLPSGSFSGAGSVASSVLPVLNWFLPISGIITCLGLYFSAWLLYLGSAPLLRWFKVTK